MCSAVLISGPRRRTKLHHAAALALLGLLVLWPIHAFGESAGELYSACKSIAEAKIAHGGTIGLRQDFDTGLCWGAFASLQKIITANDSAGRLLLGVCTSPESTRSELIAVFVEYVRRHPERRHDDFMAVALDAFDAAYPCKPE